MSSNSVTGLKSSACQEVKKVGGRYSNQRVGVFPLLHCNKQKLNSLAMSSVLSLSDALTSCPKGEMVVTGVK